MKLTKSQMLTVSFMLFSLFFGAGNLIFPPFLGQNAAEHTLSALMGFLVTAVVLPVLGVVVVARSEGLDQLGARVHPKFAIVFTVLIYLSIGPGLGIPRAASVPFEMAVAPYLPEGVSLKWYMLGSSLVFFAIAAWLALNPTKLVDRIGRFLTPSLLTLILFLFISYLIKGANGVDRPQPEYQSAAFLKGFCEGYQTMDTIAALNFGLVISITLKNIGIKEKKSIIKHTVFSGVIAGSILMSVYIMLAYMGMQSSGIYPIQENGAWTLRQIVYQLFGEFGAILLATIFTLACLTTCVGLINSVSQYFSTLCKRVSYKAFVLGITVFSFAICNQGLNVILSVSVPILNAIYPVSIILIILGLCHQWIGGNKFIYPLTVLGTAVISILYAIDGLGVPLGFVSHLCRSLPFYDLGFGWVVITLAMVVLSFILHFAWGKKQNT